MNYTCIDSFCGAGGLCLGLERAGFNILFSFDIDQTCIDTLNANPQYFNHPTEAGQKTIEKMWVTARRTFSFSWGASLSRVFNPT